MKRSLLATSMLLFGAMGSPLLAQVADDEVNALSAAVTGILTKVPPGKAAIVYNDRSAELSKKLEVKIGKKIEHETSHLDCQYDATNKRQKCALKGVSSLVNVGSISVSGDSAEAYLFIERPSGSSFQPIETNGYVVKLARVQGVWTVVSIELTLI
jgi:hypothetical protein